MGWVETHINDNSLDESSSEATSSDLEGSIIDKIKNGESYAEKDNFNKTIEGKTLDNLELTSICCRRHLLTHVEIN